MPGAEMDGIPQAALQEIQVQVRSVLPARSHRFLAIGAFALLAFAAGCHRSPSADVVATVNGKELLQSDLDKYYRANLATQGETTQNISPAQAQLRRLQILRQMVEDEILQQRAAKLNLVASDEDVNARLTEIKSPYTQDQFYEKLKQNNLTLDDLKRNLRHSLTKEKLLNKEIESKINVTDAQIRDYYNAHKAEFNLIEPQYHMAQIVVTTTPSQQTANLQNNKAGSDADARKKISALRNSLESGEDFGTLAANYSEDSNTSSNGGDMGFVAETALKTDPEVYNAVDKLKPDQCTDVLPVYDNSHRVIGYAIYKLIAREPAGQRQLNDPRVQQTIHQLLHDSQKQLLQNAYYEMLDDQAKVRNYLAEQILRQGGQ
jgi:peptidyl-prolyl cis-trans isomerase SurA